MQTIPSIDTSSLVAQGTPSACLPCGVLPARDHRRACRSARCQSWPDFRPEAPQLFEGLLPSHPRQMGEDDEGLEPEDLLHLAQRVARLLGRAHDPGPACYPLLKHEG